MCAQELENDGREEDDVEVYGEVMERMAPNLWCGPNPEDKVLRNLMEKTLAEVKCRHDKSHPAHDRWGIWEKDETHLAEHAPFLNNVSTALRRYISHNTLDDFTNELSMILTPVEADDYDDDADTSEAYDNQVFLDEVQHYNRTLEGLVSDDLKGPTKPGGRGIPYDVMEFVPHFPSVYFNSRMARLKMDLVDAITECEILAPRGDERLRGQRDHDEYMRNENFVDATLAFIFSLLAFDPGLSRVRMIEIGKLFHSMILEPWYFEFGHGERQEGEGGEGHEEHNVWLRQSIIDMDNVAFRTHYHTNPEFVDRWWGRACWSAVIIEQRGRPPTLDRLEKSADHRWKRFYVNWLQILANVELSHTKLTQEQLDAEEMKSCPVCADDYDANHEYNCAVRIGCDNNHTLCKKCYTQLSLTPTRPYTELESDKFCPQCRGKLKYEKAVQSLTQSLRLVPSLLTDFPYVAK